MKDIVGYLIVIGIFLSLAKCDSSQKAIQPVLSWFKPATVKETNVKCDTKAEAEISQILPSNEFQKKELENRKQGIFYNCMKESGLIENPDWSQYWEPILKNNALNYNESYVDKINELRRFSMYDKREDNKYPSFWIKAP